MDSFKSRTWSSYAVAKGLFPLGTIFRRNWKSSFQKKTYCFEFEQNIEANFQSYNQRSLSHDFLFKFRAHRHDIAGGKRNFLQGNLIAPNEIIANETHYPVTLVLENVSAPYS